MIFNYKNKEKINECINIHDTYFENINIDSSKKIVDIIVKHYNTKKQYSIKFKNVLNFEMNSFDLWCKSDNQILGLYVDNSYDIIKKILEIEEIDKKFGENISSIKNEINTEKLLVITILADNGNKIIIICSELEIK